MARKKFNEHPFPHHTELELEISTLTNLGIGLSRTALPNDPTANWVVMVPFTLPGERALVRIFRNHKNYSEADLVAVIIPSPHRVAARCQLFGRCGGCQYQHLTYTEQLVWKRRQVEELFQHIAGIKFPVADVIGSPRKFHYRSKITPHFRLRGTPDEREHPETVPIGFLKQSSRFNLIDVPECPIATEGINARLSEVRTETRRRIATGNYTRGATLLLRHAQEGVTTDHDAVIHEKIGKLRLYFLTRDFFQNNPFILPIFAAYVREQATATGARFLVDAYCGSGLLSLVCASAFERVAGIEISETSVQFASKNAFANGITNARFRAGDAALVFSDIDFPPPETLVVIDPPRHGCNKVLLQQLFSFGPRAVVYISCDPATQIRDLKHFITAGYALRRAQPFDFFPQTRHLECVMTFIKNL